MLNFFITVDTTSTIQASVSIEYYLNFVITVFLIFGAVFEMPVVAVILTQFGLLKPEWMVKGRSIVIVAIFFIAAIITPPDVVSQVMVALPMIVLYQLSIFLCRLFYKKKQAKEEEEA